MEDKQRIIQEYVPGKQVTLAHIVAGPTNDLYRKLGLAEDSFDALGIMTTAGVEVLIHVGVDTVEMKGDGFSPKVKEGDKVKKGDLLLEMDLDKIAAAAHPAVVITVVTNTDDFKDVEVVASGAVEPGADLIKISK